MIHFFDEDISFHLPDPRSTQGWIETIVDREGASIGELNYIFCSDDFLLKINRDYLDHDYFTDIITFDLSDSEVSLEGDIYISIDRVKENSQINEVPFNDELDRVLIHGVLHLLGYNDHEEEDRANMRKKETACLSLRHK